MGYNQNNAGMHMIPHNYRGRTDTVDCQDKYATMIAESKYTRINDEKIIEDIELCNFIMIEQRKGEVHRCLCGGNLEFKEKIAIKFHQNEKMKTVEITGKQCVDCERKLVVKSILLNAIKIF